MRKTILLLAAALPLAVLTTGCSILQEEVAPKIADAVRVYCKEPAAARDVIRATVNAELEPDGHSVRVTCAGDVAMLDGKEGKRLVISHPTSGEAWDYEITNEQARHWSQFCYADPNCTVIQTANEKGRPKPPH